MRPLHGLTVRNPLRLAGALAVAALLGLNALAYRHALALTRLTGEGRRTPRPEQLSLSQKLGVLLTGATIPKPRNSRTPEDVGLPYERQVFSGPAGLLEAWLVRAADARGLVVLFHGYVDSKDSLLPEAKAFRDLGWDALLVDFRGSGGSAGEQTSIGYHEAEDVTAALEHARSLSSGRPVVLFGASMGAAAVLRAVGARGATPDGVIVAAPFDRLMTTVAHRFHAMGLPAFPAAHLLILWGGLHQGFNPLRHNPVDYARRVTCPTLLLQGDRDERVRLDEALAVFEALAGPKRAEVFRGLGHQSFVSARPREWRSAVSAFLDGLPAGPPVITPPRGVAE